MEQDRFRLTPFTAEEPRPRLRTAGADQSVRSWQRRREKARARAGSMLAKIALCMAVLLSVVAVQAFLLNGENRAVEADAAGSGEAPAETDDVLGRLRFVNAGGVRSVFSVSQRWSAPVTVKNASLVNDGTLVCISARAGERVCLPAMGEVASVASDPTLGDYVRIAHGGDLESVYYRLDGIRVEEGQPLQVGDVLGKVPSDGVLYVAVLQGGERLDPSGYLDVLG